MMSQNRGPRQKKLNPQNRRIFVIDSDPASLEIILEPLRWEGYDCRGATNEHEALNVLASWVPHIVLLDWLKPIETSVELIRSIKDKFPHVSCIFVSNDSNTESIIDGLDAGADDYIVKPFVPLELLARIRTHLRIRDLHEQLMIANEKLKELVETDDLTGLSNMRSLYQKLEYELQRARRFGREVSVVMMDMDNFKDVNDGHDHLFGSFVLSEIGKIIKQNTRNIDLPARYGGDEFLVVLTETSEEGCRHFCERLRQAIESYEFISGQDKMMLTTSIGFAVSDPLEQITARDLVRRADHALYEAKRSGRNKVCKYSA